MERRVEATLAALKEASSASQRASLGRYGIPTERVLGVAMREVQAIAKSLGRDHDLALALWATAIYEARLVAAYVAEPARLTVTLMDRWCRDFDNWAVCDTVCFVLFDRTPLAWERIEKWSAARGEFQVRAAFALLASLAGHDKKTGDEPFLHGLALLESRANDPRNFVKKAASWALRRIGERNLALHQAARELAARLAASDDPAARWVGKDALRAFASPAVAKRLEKKAKEGAPKARRR